MTGVLGPGEWGKEGPHGSLRGGLSANGPGLSNTFETGSHDGKMYISF